MFITACSNLWLGWGLNQTCSSPWELSNGVSHSTCTHRDRVDSWLLVVGSQTASLTLGFSFDHNLCCRYPNGSCEAILDIYTSRPFQRYKEQRCFDPCNWTLSFWESRRTLKSHFQECEWRPHTSLKVGLQHLTWVIFCWIDDFFGVTCLSKRCLSGNIFIWIWLDHLPPYSPPFVLILHKKWDF
jgi:hypothetical protein